MKLTIRDKRLVRVLIAHKHEWLTSMELYAELGRRWERHGFKGAKSVEQVLRRFPLLKRKRYVSLETEYFCDFSAETPKVI